MIEWYSTVLSCVDGGALWEGDLKVSPWIVGILHGLTDWTRHDLLAFLVDDSKRISTAAALGFGTLDVASAQARHEATKRTAALA